MIACLIKDVKQFMNILLNSETFDKFLLEKCRIVTSYTMEIDGRTVPEYFEGADDKPDNLPEFVSWHDIRPVILARVKGRRTPHFFQFTLHADADYTRRLIEKHQLSIDSSAVKCLLVNIRFEQGRLVCITGTALTMFIPDRSLEKLWDDTFKKSLDALHIHFEEQ